MKDVDDLIECYSKLLADKKSPKDAPHITWVGARDVLRRAIREAYEMGMRRGEQPITKELPTVNRR